MSGAVAPLQGGAVGGGSVVVPQSITATPSHATSPRSHHKSAAEDDGDTDSHASFVCQFDRENNKWEKAKVDYKSTILQRVMDQYQNREGSRATIDQLKEFGITVYLAEHDSVDFSLLKQVAGHVAASKSDISKSRHENQRCLLYRDENGRLFNLTLDNGSCGLAQTWRASFLSYSGLQATVALAVLTRAYACADVAGAVLRPGHVALLLGLVLHEEISHVWLNVSLLVRGTPSVAAHALLSRSDSDWPRKLAVFFLALTSAMEEGTAHRRYCTLAGVGLAIILLAANLGSRAWRFMKWKPVQNSGGTALSLFAPPILSLLAAALTGLVFPYMGFGRIQAGGKAALQLVIVNSITVAAIFVASDLDVFKQFIVAGGSHSGCDQSNVNIAMGVWFAMTSISSILAARKIANGERHPEDGDPLLVEEQTSPVGYRVPNFPNFPMDPTRYGREGFKRCSMKMEIIVGVVASIGVGAFVVSTGLYDYVGDANEYIAQDEQSAHAAMSELV